MDTNGRVRSDAVDASGRSPWHVLASGVAVTWIGGSGHDWAGNVDDEPALLISTVLLVIGVGLLALSLWKIRHRVAPQVTNRWHRVTRWVADLSNAWAWTVEIVLIGTVLIILGTHGIWLWHGEEVTGIVVRIHELDDGAVEATIREPDTLRRFAFTPWGEAELGDTETVVTWPYDSKTSASKAELRSIVGLGVVLAVLALLWPIARRLSSSRDHS